MSGRLDMDCMTGFAKRETGPLGTVAGPGEVGEVGEMGGAWVAGAAAPSARGASSPFEAVLTVLQGSSGWFLDIGPPSARLDDAGVACSVAVWVVIVETRSWLG